MRWLRFYARIFCSLMGALSLVSGLSLFTLIERAVFFFCAAVFLFLFFLFSLPNFYYLWKRSDYFSVTRRNFAGFALLQLLLAVSYAFSYAVGAFLALTLITAYIA